MKCYLVGGCVRDQLLGLPASDRDWVVVGETEESMIAAGFEMVGRGFPVFLHPETHEEYALARTEKKEGHGYRGFCIQASPDVTLEEDLRRRDLTINAIARSPDGVYVDPFGGQADLSACILRHVSDAFVEDPVRILRVARFAARFPDFAVAPETLALMRGMRGELSFLVSERIGQEWIKAMSTAEPRRFFDVLASVDALSLLFPDWVSVHTDPCFLRALSRLSSSHLSAEARCIAILSYIMPNQIVRLMDRMALPKRYEKSAVALSHFWTAVDRSPFFYIDLFDRYWKLRHTRVVFEMHAEIIRCVCENGMQVIDWLSAAIECFLKQDPHQFFQLSMSIDEAKESYRQVLASSLLGLYPDVLPHR